MNNSINKTYTKAQQELLDAFQAHVEAELNKDLKTTLATMTDNPHLNNIPTLIGGMNKTEVESFYANLISNDKFFPPDTEMLPISRTIDEHQLVDEIVFMCTHTHEIGWMLPNILPTGKRIEIPLVVIVGFNDKKVTHEHIYWDQASVLVQIGLINDKNLPINGIETANKMKDIKQKMSKVD